MIRAKDNILPGVSVSIGGIEYIAAPLNFGALRAVMPLMANIAGHGIAETHAFIEAVLRHALRRNYDGVDQIWLETTLEASEFEAAARATSEILALSGVIKKEPDSGEPAGEQAASRSV